MLFLQDLFAMPAQCKAHLGVGKAHEMVLQNKKIKANQSQSMKGRCDL